MSGQNRLFGGTERLKHPQGKCVHRNQKPLSLIEKIIVASSDPMDAIWEPFGGLCPAAVVSEKKRRRCYSAEINPDYYKLAKARIEQNYDLRASALFPEFV